ncbi:hypothetical protein TKK_0002878 [Trichogramma kaykai]
MKATTAEEFAKDIVYGRAGEEVSFQLFRNNNRNFCGSSDPPLADPRVNRIASPAAENTRDDVDAPEAERAAVNFTCTVCSRVFTTQRGLSVHFRQHLNEVNARIEISSRGKHWKEDEMQLLAKEEARAVIDGFRFFNQHLCQRFNVDLVRAQGLRRKDTYKQMVRDYKAVLEASGDANDNTLASSSSSSVEVIVTPRNIDSNNNEVDGSSSGCDSFRQRSIFEAIGALIRRLANITTHKADVIRGIAEAVLREDQISSVDACVWLDQVFPSATTHYPRRRCYSRRQRKKISKRRASYGWRKRRREYAKMQELFGSKMSAAGILVLDGRIMSVFPSMEEMVSFWEPILTTPSKELDGVTAVENRDLQWIADPVSMRELLACEVPLSSAPGPDSITSRQWRSIPISLRALFLNVILALGGFHQTAC